MSTKALPGVGGDPAGPGANPHGAALAKQTSVVQTELGKLFHECHQLEPDGPMCGAIQKLMSLVAEIQRYFEQNHGAPGAGGPVGPPPGADAGPPPGPPMGGSPLQGPAAGLHAAMLANAQQQPGM